MNKSKKKKYVKSSNAITLIALVVTIIVLIILAGISISLILGENGIIDKSKQARNKYEEEAAIEKLEMVLTDLQADKFTNTTYNENQYVDDKLIVQGMTPVGDIILVDGWQFEIDRPTLTIKTVLGKGQENKNIEIAVSKEISEGFIYATLTLQVKYTGTISEILINGKNVEVPEAVEGVYTVTQDVTENGKYSIVVKDEDGNYKIGTEEVTDIMEDMDIYTKADLEKFRDNVNKGMTYEGKTVRLMSDIYLNEGKYTIAEDGTPTFSTDAEQWTPIGNYSVDTTLTFKGTFEGNKHTIDGLYINSTNYYQGLFGKNEGLLQNVILKNIYVKSTGNYVGGLVGSTSGKVNNIRSGGYVYANAIVGGIVGETSNAIEYCINMNTVIGYNDRIGGIVGHTDGNISRCGNYGNISSEVSHIAGGIAGHCYNNISECYNFGKISTGADGSGGIVGQCHGAATIKDCYNRGAISGYRQIAGIVGDSYQTTSKTILNCYNTGSLSGNDRIGSIAGQTQYTQVNNCIWLSSPGALGNNAGGSSVVNSEQVTEDVLKSSVTRLGDAFKNDIQDEKGNWIYNDGFPILSWQLEM